MMEFYRKIDGWDNDEGIVYMGEYNSHYGCVRLTEDRCYLGGISNGLKTLELSKLNEGKLEYIGDYSTQGIVLLIMPMLSFSVN